ncbi:YkgJ family cysteine cluster protein [Paenibacillus anseongense]|uniref:YkgJ family cysteine cluster protein n=1 Tax=Paenibacillus anseongense TaxID=2682845 RepID=UPI001C88047F|nr:YkgJ family cysteine cluster protein [Paenibacillus anseongense]
MLDRVPELSELDRGDGTCIHFVDNLCAIYATRPLICNVEKMYESVFKKEISREEFFTINLSVCKQLQIQAGLPVEKQI